MDFGRLRGMQCHSCGHEWRVDAEWLERFDQGKETCQSCGTDCHGEDRPDFWALDDAALGEGARVRELYWYHSSTHANWPNLDLDPTATLTEVTKRRFETLGTDGHALDRWAAREKTRAIHLGTYEAAIENMLRRMSDQDGSGSQYYLYRVRLSAQAVVDPGVHPEPTDFVGNVQLEDVAPGVDVLRYVNTHEDPSSISLAVSHRSIGSVQGIPIPPLVDQTTPWVRAATTRLREAASRPPRQPQTQLERMRRRMPSAVSEELRELEREVASTLPLGLRDRFSVGSNEDDNTSVDPAALAAKLAGLAQLVLDPSAIFSALDDEPCRTVSTPP